MFVDILLANNSKFFVEVIIDEFTLVLLLSSIEELLSELGEKDLCVIFCQLNWLLFEFTVHTIDNQIYSLVVARLQYNVGVLLVFECFDFDRVKIYLELLYGLVENVMIDFLHFVVRD